jgi:DNA invertase Pin-like site-specific DNA recombinase
MKIGYIRVSKQEQNEALQRDALERVWEMAKVTSYDRLEA